MLFWRETSMKKALAMLLSILLLIAAVPLSVVSVSAATSGTTGDCRWTLVDGHLTISGKGEMGDGRDYYYSPWGGDITSVTIEEGVTTIGANAFSACIYLTSVTIPDSVTSIHRRAFTTCDGLTSLVIPDSVTYIGEDAFSDCDKMLTVTIGSGVQTIGTGAFSYNQNMTAFYVAKDNPSYTAVDEALYDKTVTTLISYPAGKTGHYTIPDGVTTLGYACFTNSDLSSVTIPNSIAVIADKSFVECDYLTSLSIPDSVIEIGTNIIGGNGNFTSISIGTGLQYLAPKAFSWASYLESIEVAQGNPYFQSVDNVLFTKDMSTLIQYPVQRHGEYVVPDTVTTIATGAFLWAQHLTFLTLPQTVTIIEEEAFSYDGLFKLSGVGYKGHKQDIAIGDYNSALTSKKWYYNFCGPDSSHVYTTDCDSLCNICLWERTPPQPAHPNSDNDIFRCDICQTEVLQYICVNNKVTITRYINCVETHLDIPATINGYPVTRIGKNAFNGCNLKAITLPNSLIEIGENAFAYTSFSSVSIPDGVTTIEEGAFFASTLTSVTFPNSLTFIGKEAFALSSLSSVSIPDGVTTIEADAFYKSNLKTVTLPNSLSYIGESAFSNIPLTSVVIPSSVTSWGSKAFAYSSLRNVEFSLGCTSIPEECFSDCYYLQTVSIPASVKTIETGAFRFCSNLSDIYYGGSEADRNNGDLNLPLSEVTWHYNTCDSDKHQYVSACDRICENCDWVRDNTANHIYDYDCDADCNVCGEERSNTHVYDDFNDPDCNICGAQRGVNYIYPNVDIPVNVSEPNEFVDFTFVPEKTGWYEFYSLSTSTVVYCGIYDSESGQLLYYFHGPTSFKEMCELTAGTTYVVRVGLGFNAASPFTMRIKLWEEGFYYTVVNNETVAIKSYLGTVPKVLAIPSEIEGYPVTTIASRAFYNVQGFTTLYIPDSVTYIGERAFSNCDKLTAVFLGNGITTIEGNTFESCSALTSVYLSDSVTSIEIYAFYACNALTDVYYAGNEQDKENMYICNTNTALKRATWHYNYTPEPTIVPGDANGDDKVNNRDLGMLQQHLNGWEPAIDTTAMDVNDDGRVNNRDLGVLQQYLNGWETELK